MRNRLKILIYVAAGILFVAALFDRGPSIEGLTRARLALVEGVLFALVTWFDRWLWRLRPVVAMLRTGPVLRGTWKGIVTARDTGAKFDAYLLVRQTFSHLETRLMTAESMSDSTSCQLTASAEGLTVLDYVYQNTPRATVRDRSEIHFGAARLECSGQWPTRLEGEYWTSRRTGGELVLSQRSPELAQSFDEARRLFDRSSDIDRSASA